MKPVIYQNLKTGEKTESKELSEQWFNEGADIAFWTWSELFGEYINSMDKVHGFGFSDF